MKSLLTILICLFAISCSKNGSENEDVLELSCSTNEYSSSDRVISSSSSAGLNSFRMWVLDDPFGKTSIMFNMAYLASDSSWLEYNCVACKFWKDSVVTMAGFLYSHGGGYFDFPDSTFLRGDTIQYRLAYTLDGKLDSTEWQEYGFLGNHITFKIKNDTFAAQQFDSIKYPIELGPDDSCGKALAVFMVTMSVLDTFDYEANWDTLFSDGRKYIDWFDLRCMQERNPMFGNMYLMSYEGNINEAAKAMQKINPVFFLNLVPWCSEYVDCEIPEPQ